MKKTILFVLLLLFSCMSDDDPVSPPEPPKDSVDTAKADTNEVDTPIIPQTALIIKEKADTIMFNLLLEQISFDTARIFGFVLIRFQDSMFQKGDTIALLENHIKDSSMTIVLEEDSWVYYSEEMGIDCPTSGGYTIINARTGEITQKIGGYSCANWYIKKDFINLSPNYSQETFRYDRIDILEKGRLSPKYSGRNEHLANNELYGDK